MMAMVASLENRQIMIEVMEETQRTLSQLSELQDLQRNYITRLIENLKILLAYINETIPLDAIKLGCPFHNIKEACLVREAQLIIKTNDGKMLVQPLSELEAEKIIMIIEESLPTINRLIAAKKQILEERVDLLEHFLLMMNPVENFYLSKDSF